MNVRVSIIDGPLPPHAPDTPVQDGAAGAVLLFEGVVRGLENDEPIAALSYEVYEPMASRMLERLARDVVERHALLSLEVQHSRGVVPVGRASLRVRIEAAHRAESLAAMAEFIDLLKRDVPIWKMPVRTLS